MRCEAHYRNQKQDSCEITHPPMTRLVVTNLQTNDDEKEEPELVFNNDAPECLDSFGLLTLLQ